MRIRWSETALIELDNIFRYIFESSPLAAPFLMFDAIDAAADEIVVPQVRHSTLD